MSDIGQAKTEDDVRFSAGRGPAYPSITLAEAVTRAVQIKDANAHKMVLAPETVFRIWGFKGSSGASRPILASMNYYGLLEYVGRGGDRKVKLSDLAIRIVLDKLPDSKSRASALREAALKPAIFARLHEHFGMPLPSDLILEHFLTLECNYSESAAVIVIEHYKDTLAYARLDKPDNLPSENGGVTEQDPPAPAARVGDLVQVEINGAFQLQKPARVRSIQDHEGHTWVFVEGSETGIPMEQVVVQTPAPTGGTILPPVPPSLPEAPTARDKLSTGEKEWLRGPLSKDTSYRLIVSGDLGPKEIGKLIKLLKAQQAVLSDEDDEDGERETLEP